MIIDLLNLDCEVDYIYEPPSIGGKYDDGSVEYMSASLTITSVKCQGIEIIKLVPDYTLREMEKDLLEGIAFRN